MEILMGKATRIKVDSNITRTETGTAIYLEKNDHPETLIVVQKLWSL